VNSWEKAYRETDNLWGDRVDRSLIEYSSLLNDGDAVLDLGMGKEGTRTISLLKGIPSQVSIILPLRSGAARRPASKREWRWKRS
jgi:hypothetical protein